MAHTNLLMPPNPQITKKYHCYRAGSSEILMEWNTMDGIIISQNLHMLLLKCVSVAAGLPNIFQYAMLSTLTVRVEKEVT